ncbi:FG-GAP-like repeat-containing protein [Actinacidiphila bryophytorum]|uniref:FG-GAP-like repeat-containing protein n=1 Tax=Actinacidiphila bryophytorum TaxID=1436133 RepID=UPI002176D1AC|nr:FG-GAP-like repeat-containing protein [Actinacidiphila bryophytorum]UWE13256.1 FG-GAP-like repeat-containing protein [Actinacidiphila bryophytorum]
MSQRARATADTTADTTYRATHSTSYRAASRATTKAVLAGCVALAIGATLSSAPAATADTGAAPGPSEIKVIPPDDPAVPPSDSVLAAGTSGYVHLRQGATDPVWTDYATGSDRSLPALAGIFTGNIASAGGDAFYQRNLSANVLKVGSPDRDALTTYQLPAGFTTTGVAGNGTRALVFQRMTSTAPAQVEVLDLGADGGVTPVPVTGLPEGAVISQLHTGINDGARHALVRYQAAAGAATQYALVDLDTGAATTIPWLNSAAQMLLTPSDVAWVVHDSTTSTAVVNMLPVSAVLDGSAAAMAPATVTVPESASTTTTYQPVGNHLLAGRIRYGTSTAPNTLLDYPFGSGDPTTLMGADVSGPFSASDGSVLAVGGADETVLQVHRYTLAADGSLDDATALDLPPLPSSNAGLSLDHGYLRHVQNIPVTGIQSPVQAVYNFPLAPGTDAASGAQPFGSPHPSSLPATVLPCEAGKSCVRIVPGNWYGTSYLTAGTSGNSQIHSGQQTANLPFAGGRIVDVSMNYAVVASATTQYVIYTTHEETVRTGPVTGASLWDNTLWQASTTAAAGTVNAFDLATSATKVVRTIATGVACRPTELQVSQHWLYWSCGTTGQAGVYDLTSGRKITVPSGQALLGDGYLVQHDAAAGQLVMVDFHSGTAATPQTLAHLPDSGLTDDRGITFAVDRHGSDLAYVAADRTVHVLASGVPASPPTASTYTEDDVDLTSDPIRTFRASVSLDRPVDSWKLTISDAAGGKVAATFTGGPVLEEVNVSWDGRLPSGALAQSGPYTWTLTATADGTSTAVQGASGQISVLCGAQRFHSYDCTGRQAMLGIKHTATGYEGHWWSSTANGRLADGGNTDDWIPGTGTGQTSAIVPFGDINGDDQGDLLARDPSGVLTAYLGIGQAYFNTDEPSVKHVRIGAGWNIYKSLLSTGDLNGDGHDDLVAEDTAGVLWFYAGTGKSTLKSRVRIGAGWNIYTRLVAVGDLTGDGAGDLVAVDAAGAMWRYSGDKHGSFTTRVKIGAGWNMYNALVGFGDLSHDGHNDLVARDPQGRLWRYNGTASGIFSGARVQIGTGWSSYVGLY